MKRRRPPKIHHQQASLPAEMLHSPPQMSDQNLPTQDSDYQLLKKDVCYLHILEAGQCHID